MWEIFWQNLKASIDLLLPPACLLCGEQLGNHEPSSSLCVTCQSSIKPLSPAHCSCCAHPFPDATSIHLCENCLRRPPHFTAVHTAASYQGSIKDAIHRMKYRGRFMLARPLGELLGARLIHSVQEFVPDYIIPVPLHPKRLRQRGYNQALEIARPVAVQLARPLEVDLLQRVRYTRRQQGLSAAERRRNLRDAFKLEGQIREARILLVDDVMTTGETARACCRALRAGGAAEVQVAVVGRA